MIDLEIGSVVTIKSVYHDTLTKECLEIKENKREDRAQLYANRVLKNCKILDKKGGRTKIDFGLGEWWIKNKAWTCLLYTSPSPRDLSTSRMPSSA